MKLYCSIVVTLLAALSVSADSAESNEIEALIVEKAKICQKETNASEKDVDEMLDGAKATTPTTKCLHSCLLKKLEVVNAANKLEPENLIKMMIDDTIKSKDGKTIKSVINSISDACKSVTDPDECEAGVKIIDCLNAEAVKLGFEKGPF
ncbi:general odorant-binding protein 19d-like [Bradysia coprophila]|uniref:general odorant-binding protein 19d-like n=1 Tax=Bradysia coprophila TaxID=38358 RepID=UPI00187DD076|nr:general odorant-binding protein 19d-like [Bradysia coprophila]